MFRIMAEFVDGFEDLAGCAPAVSIFGSARCGKRHKVYRETEEIDTAPNVEVDTFTAAGTISYGLTKRLAITTGLGKGFADTDNPSKSMEFTNGDLSTGIVLGWSTPGLKHFERDSVAFSLAYEYNFTQDETTLSFDVAFGWSF